MKGINTWSFERFRPAVNPGDNLYINQVIPSETSVTLRWNPKEECTVFFRKNETGKWESKTAVGSACFDCLPTNTEFEFFLENSAGERSQIGYAGTGYVPGTVVNYLSPKDRKYAFSGNYLCTPCLLAHPDGYYLASMDVYANATPQNLTLIFRSDDKGKTWYHFSELYPCEWGTLFLNKGEVYMLATSTEYGDMLIGKSSDGGKTWGMPTVIHRGAGRQNVPGWHKSSGKVISYKGRLWCSYDFGAHKAGGHSSALISIDENDDLTVAENWSITEPLRYCPEWEGANVGDNRGFIEGTPVVGRDGELFNFLRYSMNRGQPNFGLAGMLRADAEHPEQSLSFAKFTPFPGNHSKFDILWNEEKQRYYSIVSRIRNAECANDRNLLSLLSSKNLEEWKVEQDIIDFTDHDPLMHGFQYVSFLFEGDEIIFLCRTATNGANSFHDSNYITFHKIKI